MKKCDICPRKVKRRTSCIMNKKKVLLCPHCYKVCKENKQQKLSMKDFYNQQLAKKQNQKFIKQLLKNKF